MPTAVAPGVPALVLEPSDRAPALARRFVAGWFREWGIADDSDARVIVSELVTNSVMHGEGPIVVRVVRDERDARPVLEVWDGGEGRPEVRPEDHATTSGRGLVLVSHLAIEWGTRPLLESGKITWAKC
ncbi:ATP-binding protein [Actinomadura madurae]|uniref:ATP-binding protein n=1 Tax=Actinomadura madurae TaxID=1993 RepID=UPI0020D2084F|nr:ATP-binding protein [Actinomadura madurae]MCP9952990.1 ATP-binding protein [Actinomadura madurae]MCP9969755.1 ATP-binding protein [Actinomadura madurae]MCP9982207.1 ATP-binding protein [Actinomadura madurae]MCQ0006266.1 ATP-binding protein [Actinomadura madurae]MCQ0018455.1 ATP-binding protein [Actinomadura madurae]